MARVDNAVKQRDKARAQYWKTDVPNMHGNDKVFNRAKNAYKQALTDSGVRKSFEDMMSEKIGDSFEKITPEQRQTLDKLYQNGEIDDTNYFNAIDGEFDQELEDLS